LKEFNNHWFVIGREHDQIVMLTLALDRIIDLKVNLKTDYVKYGFNPDQYYKNTYGVTVLDDKSIIDIVIKIDKSNAPYVLTKPFHHSQQLIKRNKDGSVLVSLRVHHNFEIERLLLGFADSIQIIKPRKLRNRMKKKFQRALGNYNEN